jgi:predicted lipid carrier protein YhbT
MNQTHKNERPIRTSELLFMPLRVLPAKLHSQFLVTFLNRILKQQLMDGELEFVKNRNIRISVSDAGIMFNISLSRNRLIPVPADLNHDLIITAKTYDFLMLAARQDDPDTLVFQRRLTIQGDTELGLELKYFLDSLDLDASKSFSLFNSLLQKSLPVYKRLFG